MSDTLDALNATHDQTPSDSLEKETTLFDDDFSPVKRTYLPNPYTNYPDQDLAPQLYRLKDLARHLPSSEFYKTRREYYIHSFINDVGDYEFRCRPKGRIIPLDVAERLGFKVGMGDAIFCPTCRVGLMAFEVGEDITVEHMLYSPKCPLALRYLRERRVMVLNTLAQIDVAISHATGSE